MILMPESWCWRLRAAADERTWTLSASTPLAITVLLTPRRPMASDMMSRFPALTKMTCWAWR